MARDDVQLGTAAAAKPPARAQRTLGPLLLTLALGAVGGAAFKLVTLPLPWMLGAMTFVTIGALAGLRLMIPRLLRAVMVAVLGIMLGSAFTPQIVARMGEWAITLSALTVWTMLVGGVALVYFRKVAGYDPVTAFFSATPGGLNEMVIVGGHLGGDERTISLTHAARILLVVFTIPVWYRYGMPTPPLPRPSIGILDLAWQDVLILGLCIPIGSYAARALKLPASFLIGPMVLSAIVHLGALTTSKPPDALVAAAQVVIGSAIGARFGGVTLSRIARTTFHAAASAVMMLAATVAFAVVLARWTGYPIAALVLAFSPGGLAEMSLIALALSVDAAFVASHHIARILMVVTMAPFVFRLSRQRA